MKTVGRAAAFAAVVVIALTGCGGQTEQTPAAQLKTVEAAPEIVQIYNRSCISCHASGAGGAPRTGDQAGWKPRLEQGAELLLDHTMAGFQGMPPMGMCMDCNEEQFLALIEYMAADKITAP